MALLSGESIFISHNQIKSFLMSIRHAARASAHANEHCSLQEVFVHSGDGYGSFAANKVGKKEGETP